MPSFIKKTQASLVLELKMTEIEEIKELPYEVDNTLGRHVQLKQKNKNNGEANILLDENTID